MAMSSGGVAGCCFRCPSSASARPSSPANQNMMLAWLRSSSFSYARCGDCFQSRRRLEAEIRPLRHQPMSCSSAPPLADCFCVRPTAPCSFGSIRRCLRFCRRRNRRQACDCRTLASNGLCYVLAVEGPSVRWTTTDRQRCARPDPKVSFEDPLWTATKIHGELLKLGIDVAQSTVSIYMTPRWGRPLQTWKSFLRNHAEETAWIDLLLVPQLPFAAIRLCCSWPGKGQLLSFAVTQNPTAEWLAREITGIPVYSSVPINFIRDNDRAFGGRFKVRLRTMGIRDRPPRSARLGRTDMLNA